MAKVKCKLCSRLEDGFCKAKKSGGKHPTVKPGKYRICNKYKACPDAFGREIDKEYEKSIIPVFSPTWRYYASKKELKEAGEEKGQRYVRTNPYVE